MKADLKELKLTERELKNLTGFDVNEIFIGGVFGGVYKPSIFQNPKRLAYFCLTEISVFILILICTLPIGLFVNRNPKVNDANVSDLQFLQITLGISLIMCVSWNLYMFIQVKRIKVLVHLLDEVDKYNEVIQAINVFDKLEAVGNIRSDLLNRKEVFEALNVTRDSLVCGLMTEKIIRENRVLLARRYDLFDNIKSNLTTLRTLEVNNQANEYGEFLNNALQIGINVHKEMQKLSHFSNSEL